MGIVIRREEGKSWRGSTEITGNMGFADLNPLIRLSSRGASMCSRGEAKALEIDITKNLINRADSGLATHPVQRKTTAAICPEKSNKNNQPCSSTAASSLPPTSVRPSTVPESLRRYRFFRFLCKPRRVGSKHQKPAALRGDAPSDMWEFQEHGHGRRAQFL